MATDPRTMTAGSEVADTLQAILARKRDSERQAMLDRLAAEEQSSVQAAREAEQKRMSEATAAQIAASNEGVFQSKLGNLRRGTTSQNIQDEGLRTEMMNRGLFDTKGIQGPTQSGEGDLGSISSYRGTAKEETEDNQKMLMQELGARYPDMPGLDVLAAGGPAIPSMLSKRVNPTVYDPDTHRATTVPNVLVPENDAFHVSSRRPVGGTGGAAYAPKSYRVIDDATGKDIGGVPLGATDMSAWYEANPGRSLRPASFQAKDDPQVAATLRNSVTAAKQALAVAQANDKSRMFSSYRDPSSEVGVAQATLEAALGQLLAADSTTPQRVKDLALTISSDPDLANLPVAEILSSDLADENGNPIILSPAEQEALGKVLASINGVSVGTP